MSPESSVQSPATAGKPQSCGSDLPVATGAPLVTPKLGVGARFPFHVAGRISMELLNALQPHCEQITVAGSLRRLKADVGDIEILYVPRFGQVTGESLFPSTDNLADRAIEGMLAAGWLAKRKNIKGATMWGDQNKLAVHVASGIPVDLFATTAASWFNYLVCRTGPADSNKRIAAAAQAKGWTWKPYSPGFTRLSDGEQRAVTSEEEVFQFVGLPYQKPQDRT